MSNRTIIYGNIVDAKERPGIEKSYSDRTSHLCWKEDPILCEAEDGSSLVYVDLDDPRFAAADFLVSLATAGERVKLIGKSRDPKAENVTRFAKLGVSEVLTPDECLRRLYDFLSELENTGPSVETQLSKFTTHALIGVSTQTVEIRKTIRLLSEVDFPSALILGETGTGKSLVCKILHNAGTRSKFNLVEVNCSAIPDELFESELFGHVKGAFTDAKTEKVGLFEYARDGTLFLDEVGNLSASAQAKLLKILEDKKLRKVGAVDEKDINVRVVAATNTDLGSTIRAGSFRQDLYFRLNLLTIRIPPLRERPEDIPEIVDYYLGYYATNYGKPGISIHPDAINIMCQHSWPGNVRELCNVIERSVLLNQDGVVGVRDIGSGLKASRISIADRQQIAIDVPPQGISLREIEQSVVKQVLNMCNWNKSEASKFLRISRPRLRRIIESAGLEQNRHHGQG